MYGLLACTRGEQNQDGAPHLQKKIIAIELRTGVSFALVFYLSNIKEGLNITFLEMSQRIA